MYQFLVCRSFFAGLSLFACFVFARSSAISADNTASRTPPPASGFHQGEWPFNPPLRPPLPPVEETASSVNPIDRFLLSKLEESGLKANPEADKSTLLRRLTYDLTGLPPTADEVLEFLADDSPDAYLRLVDRLLASPRFGERWAQHWLDLVRYAETEGFKADQTRANAFRYRDYVIDSFNRDRPFDEFIRQQLAGDELEPDNPEALIATGFLRLYADEDNAANLLQRRQEILDDVTDTTGLVFLGLTMGCAQCHDHKFDDILQTDYFRLQAFFASMAERNIPAVSQPELERHQAELARWQEATEPLREEIESLLQPVRQGMDKFNLEKYEPAILDCYHKRPAERTPFEEQIARMVRWRLDRQLGDEAVAMKLSPQNRARYAELQKQIAEFDALKPASLPMALTVSDVGPDAPPTHLLDGGNWRRPTDILEPGFPEFLGAQEPQEISFAPIDRRGSTTGRRSQLAHWLTRPDHPLTARVIVNRLWQHHFGRGIVATPNDFGAQGDRPSHPKLLDWLAVELVENGWSLKHIHRLIVTSAAYRRTSSAAAGGENSAQAARLDPENKLYWRANRRRLEGEAIRDAMLQVAGELSFKMHGPSARPALPPGLSDRYAWEPDKDAAQRNRRSIYVFVKRNLRYPIFEAFDQPDLHQSCARRAVTITAPQSLLMLNSELTLDLARRWAERLHSQHTGAPRKLIQAVYRSAYAREASEQEIKASLRFLSEQSRLVAEESEADPTIQAAAGPRAPQRIDVEAVADFCHAVFNSNEFISVD